MKHSVCVGISFPREIMDWIESERGDVSRSKYIFRMLQEARGLHQKKTKKRIEMELKCQTEAGSFTSTSMRQPCVNENSGHE
jgi:hypothetical protein